MRDRSASEKGTEESSQADDRGFAPLGFEDGGIEFRAGEEGENNGPGASQERDPLRTAGKTSGARKTPMTSCATVPTTISESAEETLNQMASSVATKAKPTQSADRAQAFAMSTNS